MSDRKPRRRWSLFLLRWSLVVALAGTLMVVSAGAAVWLYLEPRLPSIEVLKDVKLQVPLRAYSRDGLLFGEFGEKRRIPLGLADIPDAMVKAVLAAEDDRFYEHPGVDWQGITRAAWHLLRTGERGQGGSTITMQVARNFFLGREKTYLRKLNEIILAFKIEQGLSKDEILDLYLNKIYLGHRAYGVGAAAQVYYGKPLGELTLAQIAMIAGLPKAPSRFNPIANPERALARRDYVLRRLRELGSIDQQAYQAAVQAPVTAESHGLSVEVEAPYVAEMVRSYMVERYGEDAYTGGYVVYTTVDSRLQKAANDALRSALMAYDQRHGFRGPERQVELESSDGPEQWAGLLGDVGRIGGLRAGLVTRVEEKTASVFLPGIGEVQIPWEGLSWARAYKTENVVGGQPKTASAVLSAGDVIRVQQMRREGEEGQEFWKLVQVPQVEGALVALAPDDGAILALTGGFDFYRSKFNRAVQAERQPGSNFKPFIYSAAIDANYTPASIINDAPVVFDDPGLEAAWRPENYSGKFFGPTRLREALTKSRNLVSIRVLRGVGINRTIGYLGRFGFDSERLPRDLSLALGSGTLTPLELASGYAVFANGGFRVEPYFIERIAGPGDEVMFQATPPRVCDTCEEQPPVDLATQPGSAAAPAFQQTAALGQHTADEPSVRVASRVITPQNAWLMTSLMGDVIRRGTGRRALALKRGDLAGKTGTTNDQRDTWFSGFNRQLVTTVWVGFDRLLPLGNGETGARAALPMWMDFMRVALDGLPELHRQRPKGLVTVRIDPDSGQLATADNPRAIFETFRAEHVPQRTTTAEVHSAAGGATSPPENVTEKLF